MIVVWSAASKNGMCSCFHAGTISFATIVQIHCSFALPAGHRFRKKLKSTFDVLILLYNNYTITMTETASSLPYANARNNNEDFIKSIKDKYSTLGKPATASKATPP